MTPDGSPDPPAAAPTLRYPPGIPREIEIPNRRLPDAIAESVRRWPDRDAFRFYGTRMSYRSFWERSGRFAATLWREGFRPGDRLALYLPNCPVYPIAFLGALRLGVVVVQVSPLYLREDLEHLLSDAEPRGIVALDTHWKNVAELSGKVRVEVPFVARLRDLYPFYLRPFVNRAARRRGLDPLYPSDPGVRDFRASLRPGGEFPTPATDPTRELAVLQYTGGTTGTPKAAMLTHRNLLANALQCRTWFPTVPAGSSILLAAIPFFHVYGMTVALTYPLLNGTTVVLELRPEVREMLRLIAKHRPTELPGVPAMYRAIADQPDADRYGVRSIVLCISGSAALPLDVARRFEAITGGNLIEGYGLSEASPVTHANPVDRAFRREGSIGLPLPSTDQRIVDLDRGTRELPIGDLGELEVRGPQVMAGYYRTPSETALVLVDGWLRTGDVARIDAEGYAYIVDRKKDMINVGGLKVYPRQVEEVLERHPGIAEAAVVGVPDPELGESVRAFVVPKPGVALDPSEVIAFVRSRIAHYKAPRSVEVRPSLPKSGIQKVLRRELREMARGGATAPAG